MSPVVAELERVVKIDQSHQLCVTLMKNGVKLIRIHTY